MNEDLLTLIDRARTAGGYLSVRDTVRLIEGGNIVPDPFSVLISRFVTIGTGNLFHPSVVLEARAGAPLSIGDRNRFCTGTVIVAATGPIRIGHGNQFGEGGFVARTNRPDADIRIGDGGRYVGGVAVFGLSRLGSGSQVLGGITVDSCELGDGRSFAEPDPDLRGGVLKGHGTARGLRVAAGEVLLGEGSFLQEKLQRQTDFHPKPD
ncbi:MAG TPA: hypothetical protein VNS22_06180 [Geminicoccus sp.]|uniref:hypothetical protein n=1 Tax=Geminicoccus sp. TaxID=2024832 RepID=UPI002C70DED5|nr:hypothetical protein [Geminicoccus sp.]HWL67957.1 hypothetical protein [Geminicoccus sp.]